MIREKTATLLIGPTNVGKTYDAVTENPEAYIKGPDQWWEFYNGEETVIWDEFSGGASKVPLATLLRLLDKYRVYVENKGASEMLRAQKLIMTTNIHPYNWYNITDRMEQYRALARRFGEVQIYKGTDWKNRLKVKLESQEKIWDFFSNPNKYGYDISQKVYGGFQ